MRMQSRGKVEGGSKEELATALEAFDEEASGGFEVGKRESKHVCVMTDGLGSYIRGLSPDSLPLAFAHKPRMPCETPIISSQWVSAQTTAASPGRRLYD